MTADDTARLKGRQSQALRNNSAVIAAARQVFVENPDAKMSDVAQRAGVGQASLYRRYRSKNELLNVVCTDGMNAVVKAAEEALEDDGDAWEVLAAFMAGFIQSGGPAQMNFAGKFNPDESLYVLAKRANRLTSKVVAKARAAGVLRADVTGADLALLAGQLSTIRSGDRDRDHGLQRRYLTLLLDGLRAPGRTTLPGGAPTFVEIENRW